MIIVNSRSLAFNLTGVQRYLSEIVRHFPEDVELVAPAPSRGGASGHLWEQLRLPHLAGQAMLWSPCNTGPLRLRRQVVTIHDTLALDHPEWFSLKFATWYRFLIPRLVRRVRHVITVSEFSRARLQALTNIQDDKITVIPNAADPKFRPRPAAEIAAATASLALPCQRYLLTVGSLVPRKNLARLLAAWGAVQNMLPDFLWLVVAGKAGNPHIFGSASAAGATPPRVHFTGHVPEASLPALYAGAVGFACVSEYEGFGLPPLEAMASGVPVLVSAGSAFPEVVGNAGLYADPLDVNAIAQGLYSLATLSDTANEYSARGLLRARQFSWPRSAEKTLAVLRDAAGA
jgi:glycosyltransferase involved in cell wall biosynthesis